MPHANNIDATNITNHVVSEETVEKKVKKLQVVKSAGPGKRHPRLLKELCPVITCALASS